MNRKAVILAACVLVVVAGIVLVLMSSSGGGSVKTPKNGWTFSFTMPASNTTPSAQTNTSLQIK